MTQGKEAEGGGAGQVPQLLTIHELSGLLKISHRSIWRLVRQGQLPAPIRLGSSSRWRSDQIVVWINAQGVSSDAE
jgi:predicted DNA-binding transcriptional regulator AlpA